MNFELLKNFMDSWAKEFTPGCCAIVYKDGKEVFRHQAGCSDLDTKTPLTGNELFNIYSCSKVATVTAALQLYEKGRFLLDDPLCEYIPEFKEMYVEESSGKVVKARSPVTIRQLFTMTAGLTYDVEAATLQKVEEKTNGKMNTLDFVEELAAQHLAFEPGTHWRYSLCHDVLAAVVEVISGKKFRDYVKENIFDPLGMNSSYYHIPEDKKVNLAQQYFFEADGAITDDIVKLQMSRSTGSGIIRKTDNKVAHIWGEEYDSGGAGITTTPDDYIKLIAALANYGMGTNGEKILSAGSVELLRTNQLSQAQLADFTWPDLKGYGYGLGVRTMMDRAASGSLGFYGEFGWSGAAGSTTLSDTECNLALFFAQHIINPREAYYCPRLRNILYHCVR